MAGMAGNGWQWLEMARNEFNVRKWLKKTRIVGYGWKKLDMAESG